MPRSSLPSADSLISAIRAGDRAALGRAITLLESTRTEHVALARAVIAGLEAARHADGLPAKTIRIGISGAPGAGKSTLIEALGSLLTAQGHLVAVLAIDPSSALSKGSILGDKTRMERLSADQRAFIRPSPSGENLGGVARKTRETIALTEAAGYEIILIETVGTGQSEIAVHSMSDLFLLVLIPGAGDELQGIKRGIVEMADILVVNKSDGERIKTAQQARAHYTNALHLFPAKHDGWTPKVLQCSAVDHTGIAELWLAVEQYVAATRHSGWFDKKRQQQAQYWLQEALQQGLKVLFERDYAAQATLTAMEAAVQEGTISPFAAAEEVLKVFKGNPSENFHKHG